MLDIEIRLEIQTDTFKEIKQKRAYSPQSLIGNLGGYLGIFIGFTFPILYISPYIPLFISNITALLMSFT